MKLYSFLAVALFAVMGPDFAVAAAAEDFRSLGIRDGFTTAHSAIRFATPEDLKAVLDEVEDNRLLCTMLTAKARNAYADQTVFDFAVKAAPSQIFAFTTVLADATQEMIPALNAPQKAALLAAIRKALDHVNREIACWASVEDAQDKVVAFNDTTALLNEVQEQLAPHAI